MDAARYNRLSDGQKGCLRLFYARWEMKDIVRHIGRNPVTINQHFSAACRHLGIDRSAKAATPALHNMALRRAKAFSIGLKSGL